jgi:riboflavin kinase / FMN adenylyltransferase
MSIKVTPLPDASPRPREIAIGTFDGVHVGHRQVIDGADTVLTFEPHPLRVIHPEAALKLIMPFEIKRDVIEGLGASELVVIPFDRGFSEIQPEEFCTRILVEELGARRVAVGENFRFGKRAKGDPEMLSSRSEFETRVVPLIEVDGETVSSTRIRAQVAAGDVEGAMRCLGAPFLLEGTVVEGDKRGRTLGFPTANLVPDARLVVPDHGIYACRAQVDGQAHVAAVNVGVRPTFKTGRGLLVEAYLLDFDGDIYDRELRLDFLERLRGERRFESAEALVEQMAKDIAETRRVAA